MKKTALSFLSTIFGGILLASNSFAGPVAVELFTSQGCSSCPPADKILRDLTRDNDNVVALSMHIDYWDYLGWKDSFSSPIFSNRQRKYAQSFNKASIYTPQMVINGRLETIGSHLSSVRDMINRAGQDQGPPIEAHKNDKGWHVAIGSGQKPSGMANILLVRFLKKQSVAIAAGENYGEQITYHNIVREIQKIGAWNGEKQLLQITPDLPEEKQRNDYGYALLLQTGSGPIIAASYLR